jgi:aryl-phospho-beta-D-glucosidase BglC (GH1 family)
MRRAALLLIGILVVITLPLLPPSVAHAGFGSGDFLKASGKYIRTNSGTGAITTLRGTNLGGWLAQEDWMNPLGEFALDRSGWAATASINSSTAGNAIDGDNTSRWTTGAAQAGGEWFQVDMGSPTLLNRVYVNAAGFGGDFPAGYQVLVSLDATNWKNAASGAGTTGNTIIPFTAQVARYVRITQTGASGSWWSVAEFNAFSDPVLNTGGLTATASSTGTGFSTANALDGDITTRWSTGVAQAPGQWYTVNLGANTQLNKVLFDSGPSSPNDFPASYEIWGSTDNVNWTKDASGLGTGRIIMALFWQTTWMQYVKIVQTGTSANWWSIADFGFQSTAAFDRKGWAITASSTEPGGSVNNLKDGNEATRWSSGAAQANGQWLQFDIGATETFNQVVLDNATDTNDYPRGYTVQVSADSTNWTQVASGAGYPKATPINFPPARGRYVKITQTGTSTTWWSIDELNVYLNSDDYNANITYINRFGASTAQSIYNTQQNTFIQASDLDNIASMGINLVRVPIAWTVLLNPDGTWKTNAWTLIDWIVTQASQRNIYVLLDLHTLPGGDCPWESCGRIGLNPNEFWNNTTYQNWVNNIWQTMAARYKGNSGVAGYDLMNEPLLSFNETSSDVNQKSAVYNRLYNTVRAADPDHMIFFNAFFNWANIAPPATYGWSNVVYEKHPYDFNGGLDWNAENTLVTNELADVAAKQDDPTWSIPVLYGEYAPYQYDDIWSKWMSGLNSLHVSWTSWSYKVRFGQYDGAGGYWGLYNTDPNPVPVINNDSSSTINAKISQFPTSSFQANTSLINDVKTFTPGVSWMATVPLSQTAWTASASSSGPGDSPANAIDWNTATRWSTGASQTPGQWFQVNLGSMQAFDQISFETRSTDKWDFPRGYQIQVSADGMSWTTVKTGQGFGWKDAVVIAPQYAQYVRMTQTGNAQEWWSMAEFHVYSELSLNRSAWVSTASSSASGTTPGSALDGNVGTRWSTGSAQANGQWYQIDMGQTQTFNRVLLDAGATWAGDYPRGYLLQVSSDGTNWTTVTSGTGTAQSLLIQFPVQVARYLKIVQTGTSGNWWSIAELNVYGEQENSRGGSAASASSTESGGSPGNALDGNLNTRWSIGVAQASGQWFEVDQGSALWFNHIVMDSGLSTGDYARAYEVQVSNDNVNFQTVANGEGSGPFVSVNFPIQQARYIRVMLKGSSGSWWSIAEFRVFQ